MEATLSTWPLSTRPSVFMANGLSQQAAAASSTPNGVVQRVRRRGLGGISWHGPQQDPLSTRPQIRLYSTAGQRRWLTTASPHTCVRDAGRGPEAKGRGGPLDSQVTRPAQRKGLLQANTSVRPLCFARPQGYAFGDRGAPAGQRFRLSPPRIPTIWTSRWPPSSCWNLATLKVALPLSRSFTNNAS